MQVKICGITQPEQGQAIAKLGATALGFICVPTSPRYVTPRQIQAVVNPLQVSIDRVGVFVNAPIEEICRIVPEAGLNGVQLHGAETIDDCNRLRQELPGVKIIKALRVKQPDSLTSVTNNYANAVDALLLDAYHPQLLGGTGNTLNWAMLKHFYPSSPWFLAGGLTPDNVVEALSVLQPSGIDLSSGVERSPGDKDLGKVALLFQNLALLKDGTVLSPQKP